MGMLVTGREVSGCLEQARVCTQSLKAFCSLLTWTGYAHEGHDFQEFLFSSFAELLDIITTLLNKDIKLRKQIGSL